MTMTSTARIGGPGPDIEWRQLDRRLWTGRRAGRPAGMVEQGRRFALTDERGDAAGSYRTLRDAQAAAGLVPEDRLPLQVPSVRRGIAALAVGATVALGGGLALGCAALAVLARV